MAKSNSEFKSIQKKLVAAVAMVLVASIMVVSSSYAWFTLSTAPEVTGIQTAVGSNGNLEIALRTGALSDITSGMNATFPEANKSWGNLIDLSDSSYHMDQLALRPARLNAVLDESNSKKAEDNTYIYQAFKMNDQGGYLAVPTYGADGRVSLLSATNTINGLYDDNNGAFVEKSTGFGIRAVGTTSAISPNQLKLRNAKQAVNAAISSSKSSATISLRDDSVKLADIIIANVLDSSKTFGATELNNVKTAIGHLKDIAGELEEALKQAVVAIGVAQGQTFETKDVTITASDVTVTGKTLIWSDTDANDGKDYPDLTAAKKDLMAAAGTLATMKSEIGLAEKAADIDATNGIKFDQISKPLKYLLSTDHFDIIDSTNGTAYTVQQFREKADTDAFSAVKVILGTPTISIKDGIYYDIAQFSGNYSATTSMTISGSYGGVNLNNETVTVVMATKATPGATTQNFYLPYVVNWMSGLTIIGEAAGSATNLMTDIYGYAVDLAFRTNAAGSSLLLQTDERNRVEEGNSATQGGGSYMEFKSGHLDFSLQQVANLMGSIRVVFMDDAGHIYGVAALDVRLQRVDLTPDNKDDEEWKIATTDSIFTEVHDHDDNPTTPDVVYELVLVNAELTQNNTAIKAPLVMQNFTLSTESNKVGAIELGGPKDDSVITALPQNTPVAVSALVYLDGDTVENADVAISGNSIVGTMNLQFASDAELDPMDYTFPILDNPTKVENENGVLTITHPADYKADFFEIYDGNKLVGTVPVVAGTTETKVTLSEYITTVGNHAISVVATAKNYNDSEKITAGSLVVTQPLAAPVLTIKDGKLVIEPVANAGSYVITGPVKTLEVTAEQLASADLTITANTTGNHVITVVAKPAEATADKPVYYTDSVAASITHTIAEKLAAPTVTYAENKVTISAVTNADSYLIYLNGNLIKTATKAEVEAGAIDLTASVKENTTGTLTVVATSEKSYYTNSDTVKVDNVKITVTATEPGNE